MTFEYRTRGVCARSIVIDVDGEIINNIKFMGGCNGNTTGISSLIKGMKIDDVIARLDGVDCSGRGTSCPDQLAKALKQIKEKI